MNELSHQLAEVACKVLRTRRLTLDLSQDALSQRTGLARSYISDVERGSRHPTLHNLTLLSGALEWSTSEMVRHTEIEVTRLLDPERVILHRQNGLELTALEHELLRYITERMSDGVMITGANGEFVVYNKRAQELTGIELPHVDPETWTDLYGCFREDRVTRFHTQELPLIQALNGKEQDHTPMFLRSQYVPDGRYIEITGRQIKDSQSGSIKGAFIVFGELNK